MEDNYAGKVAADAAAADQIKAQHAMALAQVDTWLSQLTMTMVRGSMAMMFNVPAEFVVRRACWAMGIVAGHLYKDETVAVMKFRAECAKAFNQGMGSIAIEPVAKPPTNETRVTPP